MLCLPQEGNEARVCPFGSLSVAHPKPGCPLCLPVDMAEAGSDFSVRNPKLLVLMPLHFSDPSCHCFHCTQFALCSGEMSLELVLSSCSDQIVPGICWKCSPRSALCCHCGVCEARTQVQHSLGFQNPPAFPMGPHISGFLQPQHIKESSKSFFLALERRKRQRRW